MPAKLTAVEQQTADEVDAYERLLGDAMHGDAMLFVREDAVEAAWAIVEPILGTNNGLHSYEVGSWGPHEADRLAADLGWLAESGLATNMVSLTGCRFPNREQCSIPNCSPPGSGGNCHGRGEDLT